jgi:hypothetical protein
MPSRATYTEATDWRTWILRDYVRYWYGLAVFLVAVFGVGELARVGSPLDGTEVVALFVLLILVLILGLLGYALIWRRDSPLALAILLPAQRFVDILRRLRSRPASSPPNKDGARGAGSSDPEGHGPPDQIG